MVALVGKLDTRGGWYRSHETAISSKQKKGAIGHKSVSILQITKCSKAPKASSKALKACTQDTTIILYDRRHNKSGPIDHSLQSLIILYSLRHSMIGSGSCCDVTARCH
jgi:hypothetical protein